MVRSSSQSRHAVLLLVVLAAACERDARVPPTDSSSSLPVVPTDTSEPISPRATWDPTLGPVLVIAGDGQSNASVVFPTFSDSTFTDTTTFDTSVVAGLDIDLFSRAGALGTGRLRPVTPRTRDGCVAWPEASVTMGKAPVGDRAWTVGLASGRAAPVPLDSLESLTGADSARLTANVARLASMAPDDTAAAFHGIPFFVRQVWRFRTVSGTEVLVANVIRRINQEANPREEQLLLLAERDGTRPGDRYTAAYHERVSGHEETIETTDVLAAITLGRSGVPAIVLLRDYGDGSAYALLMRASTGEWRIGWSSAYAGC